MFATHRRSVRCAPVLVCCQSEDEVRESFRYWLAHVGASNLFPEKGLLEQVVHKVAAVPQRVVQSVQVAIARRKPLAMEGRNGGRRLLLGPLGGRLPRALALQTTWSPCYNRGATVLQP